MYKFNETSIVSGFIKQLLHSFNLPKFRVYTVEQEDYAKDYVQAQNKLKAQIVILERKASKTSEEQKELKRLKDLQTLLNATSPELNVIETIYQQSWDIYPNTFEPNNVETKHLTYVPYIRHGKYQEYVNGKWIDCHGVIEGHEPVHKDKKGLYTIKRFLYDKFDKNYTTQLQIKNNVYDSYTHEYLGNYLRFQRDYNKLDLMSMYNCFSNRSCDNIMLEFTPNGFDNKVKFYYNDKYYKIYMLPVKLFKDYTIAIDCETKVDMFVAVYGNYLDEHQMFKDLPKITYRRFNNLKFNNPEIYSTKTISEYLSHTELSFLAQRERDLKLFIKLPMDNKSSITILEGNYLNYNDSISSFNENGRLTTKQNHAVVNFETDLALRDFKPISKLQLLSMNTGESYPFATKLLDYLTGHAITHLDDVDDNIVRLKTVLEQHIDTHKRLYEVDGLWTDEIRPVIYNYMLNEMNTTGKSFINRDLLGYVDRDVERYFAYTKTKTDGTDIKVSLANVDIYESEDGDYEWKQ